VTSFSPRALAAKVRWRDVIARLSTFVLALLLFTLALLFIREGVAPIANGLHRVFHFNSPASALGFGWLFAELALSGSPVAAAALSLLDAGVFGPSQAFAMISGSRLGAAFIVLLVGFVHLLRGRQRTLSLGAGLLSLLVTQSTYLLVLPIGLLALSRLRWTADLAAAAAVPSPFELLLEPIVRVIETWVPVWALPLIGIALLLLTFRLFDRIIPEMHLKESRVAGLNRLLYRPIVSFLLGALLTTLTMSVSVSLGLLVPLSARGYIRQENIIPYIMGANITTFDDTLIAAVVLGNQAGISVVLVQMASVALVSLTILFLAYGPYQRLLVRLAGSIGASPVRLALYLAAMFALPLLLLIGGF
jgi:Na+/phosphate symporter